MRKRNFKSLAVKAEQKCGSGTSELIYSRQSGSAEAARGCQSRLSRSPEAEITYLKEMAETTTGKLLPNQILANSPSNFS